MEDVFDSEQKMVPDVCEVDQLYSIWLYTRDRDDYWAYKEALNRCEAIHGAYECGS